MREFLSGSDKSKFNKKMTEFLKSIQKELDNFYDTSIEYPSIFFIDSRKEINEVWERKTEEWFSAWAKDGNIYILNPDVYTKESNHKDIKHFWQCLKHEYSHLYYRKITGTGYPKWLNEGLANYLAGQVKKKPTKEEVLMVFDYYDKSDWQIYDIGYFWTKFLIEKFSKEKLLTLIKSINSKTMEKEFAKKFHQIYKFHYSKTDFEKILG
ncbi:MAG: hypothetical protein V1829_01430 [bacterium]